MEIINLTNHQATPNQLEAGVVEPAELREAIKPLLNVDLLDGVENIRLQAKEIARLVSEAGDYKVAMIGGQLELCNALVVQLTALGIQPVTAKSLRTSKEVHNDNGTVTKVAVFNHEGFRSSWTRIQQAYGPAYALASMAMECLWALEHNFDYPEMETVMDSLGILMYAITEQVRERDDPPYPNGDF